MDIHKPKAAHSWREFAIEIGTIITGILIALALEQAIEAHHWSVAVREGEQSLRTELVDQSGFYVLRTAVDPCVRQRLDVLDAAVAQARAGVHQSPLGPITFSQGALIRRDAWTALGAGGVLSHLPHDRLLAYSAFYGQAVDIRQWELDEENAWDSIRLAEGDPARLSAADLSEIRVAISRARRLNYLIALNAGDELRRAGALGAPRPVAPDPAAQRECKPLRSA